MQSNGCRNGASGEWAARRGSRKKSEAVGAPGCVEIVRAAYALFAIEKAEFVSAGGRPIRFALLDSHAFRRFSNLRFVNDWLGTLEVPNKKPSQVKSKEPKGLGRGPSLLAADQGT